MTKPHRNDKAKTQSPEFFGILMLDSKNYKFFDEETFYLLSLVSFILNILSLLSFNLLSYHLMPTLHCIFNI